jgi:ABC-type multidrug transport system fused ATPase/permease subunit
MTTMVRGALVNVIYKQTLDLSITALGETKAITLMSSDVERICQAILPIHSIWSSPLEIGLAIWLLQREVGLALLGPLIITTLAVSGPFLISGPMVKAQKVWMEKIQTRIDATAKMLQSMKGVKMLGLNSTLSSIVYQLRVDEIAKSLKMRKVFILMLAFGNMSDIFAPGAAFAIYVIVATVNGQTLDVTSAFTALSLISLLVAPIRAIVFAIPPLIAAVGCFDRIQNFLDSPTQKDHRILTTSVQGVSSSRTKLLSHAWNKPMDSNIELEEITVQPDASSSPATIRVRNLTLSWSEEANPVIDDVSLDFRPGQLTMVVGPVGCGKSSLLRGLLGEIPSSKGHVYTDRAHAAFVDQSSWIQNASIRNNIIGVSDFEPEWYANVLYACALDTDIETLPEGDGTKVGSAGAALSGGQKLRIVSNVPFSESFPANTRQALARAVYSRQLVLILDDVFSGLDSTSEERIFSRLLGTNGLLRRLGTTVILVTHAAHRLSYADHIISLSPHGTVSEQGKLGQLLKTDGYVAGLAARHTTENESAPEEKILPAKKLDADETARQNAAADLNRSVGNWSLYSYYFRSAGRRNIASWTTIMIIYSALVYFPGKVVSITL